MSEKAVTGLCAVICETEPSVAADAHNFHAGYDYASADATYAHVRRQLAEAGLAIWCSERSMEIIEIPGKKGPWIRATYELAITLGGSPPVEEYELRTIITPLANDKTSAAAATYAQKGYLRSKFLLSTGERDDLDDEEQAPKAPAKPRVRLKAPAQEQQEDEDEPPATPAPTKTRVRVRTRKETSDE